MKLPACLICVMLISACTPSKKGMQYFEPSSANSMDVDCSNYITFIKSQWEKKDSIIYQLKGNPEYWNDFNTYTKAECMLSKNQSEIEDIFGLPTKQFIFPSQSIWIYCMNEECVNSYLRYKPTRELTVSFNELGKVKSFGFNPYFSIKE